MPNLTIPVLLKHKQADLPVCEIFFEYTRIYVTHEHVQKHSFKQQHKTTKHHIPQIKQTFYKQHLKFF